VAIKDVRNDDHLMIITRNGITIRIGLDEMRVMGRATQGVRLMNLEPGEQLVSMAKLAEREDGEAETEAE